MFGEPLSLEYKENGRDAISCTNVSDIHSCSFGAMSEIPEEVQPGIFAFIYNGFGVLMGPTLSVLFDGSSFIAYVPMTTQNSGKIGGVCGNFNGDKDDDKALRDGTLSSSAISITESWAAGSC